MLNVIEKCKSSDGITQKIKFETSDNHEFEVVLVNRQKKTIICIPTQIGCSIQCRICDAGKFIRDIDLEELNQCVYLSKKYVDHVKPILISAMGVGEPTLNKSYHKYLSQYSTFIDKIAFSTSVPNLKKFKELFKSIRCPGYAKIQFSLHGIDREVRKKIFGVNCHGSYKIKEAIRFLRQNGFDLNNIEINYTLIDGVNDFINDADKLAMHFGEYKIKLNRFNQVKKSIYKGSLTQNRSNFKQLLDILNVEYEEYATDGQDIKAACGQMTSGLR